MRSKLLTQATAPAVPASVISFTGDLRADATFLSPGPSFTDGDYAQWAAVVRSFHAPLPSAMTAISFSYGGGTNGFGAAITQNGFTPYPEPLRRDQPFSCLEVLGVTCRCGAQTNTETGSVSTLHLDGGTLTPGDNQTAISAFANLFYAENFNHPAIRGSHRWFQPDSKTKEIDTDWRR
jgi:hypothetical protein